MQAGGDEIKSRIHKKKCSYASSDAFVCHTTAGGEKMQGERGWGSLSVGGQILEYTFKTKKDKSREAERGKDGASSLMSFNEISTLKASGWKSTSKLGNETVSGTQATGAEREKTSTTSQITLNPPQSDFRSTHTLQDHIHKRRYKLELLQGVSS